LEKEARVLALIDGALIGLCARRPAKPEWSSYKGISPKLWVVWCTIGKEVWQGY
jgi:hypothetical protein